MAFTDSYLCFACRFGYGLLLKEHLLRAQERLERVCFEVKYSSKLVFLDRRYWNSECSGL